jgi:hypothetical protein
VAAALSKLIVARGGVPLAHIDRFVLTSSLPGGDSAELGEVHSGGLLEVGVTGKLFARSFPVSYYPFQSRVLGGARNAVGEVRQ